MNNLQCVRNFSSTAARCGKRSFNKFNLYEMRATKQLKKELKQGRFPELEHRYSRGVRQPYLMKGGQEYIAVVERAKERWETKDYPHHWEVKINNNTKETGSFVTRAMWEHEDYGPYEKEYFQEMIPDLIVPDLDGFQLKPYVSYRVPDVEAPEFTAKDLFHAIYTAKIIDDMKNNRLNEDGSPKEPSPEEALTKEEAKIRALQTGSDYI